MKQGIHPDYQIANVHCSCGNTFQTRSTVSEIRAEHLLQLPPVLHGQAEADGRGRSGRAVPASVREDAGCAERLDRPFGRRRERGTRARPHLYGGQAVVEGVMMRGADHWAVAVRQPDGDIYVESHDIDSVAKRHPFLRKPFLRGIIVLGQSLAIGTRALLIATNRSIEDDEQLTSRQVGIALAIAMLLLRRRSSSSARPSCSRGSRTRSAQECGPTSSRAVPRRAVRRRTSG